MRIIELRAENIKKLKAIDIKPSADTVLITGKNGQGKTSVLDSIFFALGGKDAQDKTPKPIREGEKHAEVTVDIGDMIVKRSWSGHNSYLEVTSKEGLVFKSPQTMLDDLLGTLSFDPLEFSRMDPKAQRAALLEIVDIGIDLDAWEQENMEAREHRKIIGRDVDKLKAQIDAIPLAEVSAAPDVEISVAGLLDEIREAEKHNRVVDDVETAIANGRKAIAEQEKKIERLRSELKDEEDRMQKVQSDLKVVEEKAKSLSRKDTEELRKQIASADDTNKIVRRKIERKNLQELWTKKNEEYNAQDTLLNKLDAKKSDAMKQAKMPIEGLTVDAGSVMFNGNPFSQLSSAEQLKVSLSIAMAKNPKLRVIRILDGSLLDDDNLKVIGDMAKEHDFQVWVEKVDSSGKVGIVIEDGQVIADNSISNSK